MNNIPRLLVATEFAPNAAGGGPAVIRQMLKAWPVKELFWWSCLSETSTLFRFQASSHRVATIPIKLYPHSRLTGLKSSLLEIAWTPWATRHLRETLARFRPEVVWAIPHQWSIPVLTRSLPLSRLGFHVTVQDYPDGQRNIRVLGQQRCRRMMRGLETLYATATTRDATSHPMVEDLRIRTGENAAQMLHAGLETLDFRHLESRSSSRNEVIRIAYAGTIILPEIFSRFARAIGQLRRELHRAIEMHLFSAHSYRTEAWFEPGWMYEHGNLTETALMSELGRCTWGLSLMDVGDHDPQYNRFSFPTKFITYLAAGLPIITIGCSESSVAKMASRYNVGVHSAASTKEELTSTLRKAFMEPSPAELYANGILQCARNEFDADRMRSILFNCFEKCANVTRAHSDSSGQLIVR